MSTLPGLPEGSPKCQVTVFPPRGSSTDGHKGLGSRGVSPWGQKILGLIPVRISLKGEGKDGRGWALIAASGTTVPVCRAVFSKKAKVCAST